MTSAKPKPPLIPGESRAYPVLPLRDIVVFPHMIVPLFVGREKSIKALEEVMRSDPFILLATQKNASDDDPATSAIYEVGTLASVLQLLKLPDGTVKVLVEGAERARVVKYGDRTDYYEAEAVVLADQAGEKVEGETEGARVRGGPRRARRARGQDQEDQAFEGGARQGDPRAQEASPDVADVGGSDRRAQLSRLAVVDPVGQEIEDQEGPPSRGG